jgi:hypothetical protein
MDELVAQTFLSAGLRDIPVPKFPCNGKDWRQESRLNAQTGMSALPSNLSFTFLICGALTCFLCVASAAEEKAVPPDIQLFNFERAQELEGWTPLRLPDGKQIEPAASFEHSLQNATSGQHSLKITFAGGEWPALLTTNVPADWSAYATFETL